MKKVLLFVVEGITDKICLGLVMSKIFENEVVHFAVTEGDITSRNDITTSNIKRLAYEPVKNFLQREHLRKEDILKIVHLIDTDGAFIPEENVLQSEDGITTYTLSEIFAADEYSMQIRNEKKTAAVQSLRRTSRLADIPYCLLFCSRNLEHVMHDKSENLSSKQKVILAEKFEDLYADSPDEFRKFISDQIIAVSGNYADTWDYIETGTNSLQRKCNIHLLFDDVESTVIVDSNTE